MNKEIKYQDDTTVVYICGCSESRLEFPEYWQKLCKEHQDVKKIADFYTKPIA